ncbi:MAG: TetR/AcrR family transcriptional regulator [Nakamurella sp.]
MTEEVGEPLSETGQRIVRATADLLAAGGREAVSTRSVSAAAGVQAPTIYRLFGDMRGLLDAVMSYGFAGYLEAKTSRQRAADPVEDLRRGWDLHIGFGMANPALYALIYGDPHPGAEPAAAKRAAEVLDGLVHRVAQAGRLRVEAKRAAQIIHSAGCGVTLTLIALPPQEQDLAVSELTREAVLAAVTTDPPVASSEQTPLISSATTLKAGLAGAAVPLSGPELALLNEWLDRISRAGG